MYPARMSGKSALPGDRRRPTDGEQRAAPERPSDRPLTLEEAYRVTHDSPDVEAARASVLVVDDDFDILSSMAEVIREEGYDVLTAGNGHQALEHLQRRKVALIFLDLMLPQMNGWQFVEELCARSPVLNIPIVLVSAAANLVREAAKLGADGYLRKPFNLEDVVRLVRAYCGTPDKQTRPM
jgi:two-component system response regulator MprA